jgi:two-component sensor histidine kinase
LSARVEAELEAHSDGDADPGKVWVEGPPVALPANSVQMLALALHELATNAVKYGALRQPAGRLVVTWGVEGDGRRVALEWRESGVPMAQGDLPNRKGYGSELIEHALPYQLGAETRLEFGADGVRCAIVVPIEAHRAGTKHG